MKKYSSEVRDALQKAAEYIDSQAVQISSLQEKVASFEKMEKARNLTGLMVQKGLMSPETADDEEIRKLAGSNKDLDQLEALVREMSPQSAPWFAAENPSIQGGADPVAKRDRFIMTGEVE
jgi:hypothetical protein